MRRILAPVLSLVVFGALVVSSAAPVGGQSPSGEGTEGSCDAGQVEIRGVIRDAATGLRLSETANVDIYEADGSPRDGGSGEDGAYLYCAPVADGDVKIRFDGDSYRPEWWNNQPNNAAATVIDVDVPGPIIANASLTPNGLVLAGRITNRNGVPKFASIGIYRQRPSGAWVPIDGEGNDPRTGRWSYTVPGPGRYRVNACVDHHWCRWHRDATRLRFARVLTLNATQTYVANVNIAVPYCPGPTDVFCVPPGFDS